MNILFELVVAVITTRALRCRRRCVLKLETKEEMLIYIYFFFSWALEPVLTVGARCNIHSFLFFFSLKKSAHVSDFFSVSSRLSNAHTHTHTMIIILIIDVFWLVAFACVKYRTASIVNDGSGTMKSKKERTT
jgi:hypothetical protein